MARISVCLRYYVSQKPSTKPMTDTITPLVKITIPIGGQVIELQQFDHASGGMSLLRTRIREKSRFTVFEIDPDSAKIWGETLLSWAASQTDAVAQNHINKDLK